MVKRRNFEHEQPRAQSVFDNEQPEMPEFTPPQWHLQANCFGEDPDLFFAGQGESDKVAKAKAICEPCPVQQECLDYALDNSIAFGVWGNTSEQQRRRIRRDRRLAKKAQQQ